jgi:hypothetical protein
MNEPRKKKRRGEQRTVPGTKELGKFHFSRKLFYLRVQYPSIIL